MSKVSRRLTCAALGGCFAVVLACSSPQEAAAQSAETGVTTGEFQVVHWTGRRHRHYWLRNPFRPRYVRRNTVRRNTARRNTVRHYRVRRTYQQPPATADWFPNEESKEPVQIIVSLPQQKLTVYQGDKVLVTSRVSSGREGYSTPSGVFSILRKKVYHRSNIYSGAPMPFMQRLTWSGIALHESNAVPDHPASHGCIRLPGGFAGQLYTFTQMGIHVVVANEEVAPVDIAHENLFRPVALPPEEVEAAAQTDGDVPVGDTDTDGPEKQETEERSKSPVRILITRRNGREQLTEIQELLDELEFEPGDIDGYMGPDTARSISRFQTTYGLPVNGLVSEEFINKLYEKSGRGAPPQGHIYLRQDFNPVMDGPVFIKGGDKPLGSHLYTAMHFEEDATEVRWLTVTLTKGSAINAHTLDRHQSAPEPEEVLDAPVPSTAAEALDRIEIPAEMRRRINEMLTPGSSLAITNDGISHETTPKGTDFVVLMQ